jgi:hypothetical protein
LGSYQIGVGLRKIHEEELWKVDGHKTFRKYVESRGISGTTAHDLMRIVENFSEDEYVKHGRHKLVLVASVGPEDRNEMMAAVEGGASRSDLTSKAKEKSGSRKATTREGRSDSSAEKEDVAITLIGSVGGKPKTTKWRSRKNAGADLAEWEPEAYVEIPITDSVVMMLTNRVVRGKITGITYGFRSTTNSEIEEPAKKASAKAAKKSSKKAATKKGSGTRRKK